jgi:hypothetical protein
MQGTDSRTVIWDAPVKRWLLRNFLIAVGVTFIAIVAASVVDSHNVDEGYVAHLLAQIVASSLVGCALPLLSGALWFMGSAEVYLLALTGVRQSLIVRPVVALIPVGLTALTADSPVTWTLGLSLGIIYAAAIRLLPVTTSTDEG